MFLSSVSYIKQICSNLELLDITHFTYLKKYSDGTEIYLSNNGQWIEDYYTLSLFQSSLFEKDFKQYQKGFFLWPNESNLPVFKHGRDYFDSTVGFTYCLPVADGCEFFFFSTSAQKAHCLNIYINQLDLFEAFVNYFKDQAQGIINKADSHRILLPTVEFQINQVAWSAKSEFASSAREQFLQALNRKTNLSIAKLTEVTSLTNKEKACLSLLTPIATAENIAKQLNISKRTVETHLDHIKSKLNCSNKAELLLKIQQFQI